MYLSIGLALLAVAIAIYFYLFKGLTIFKDNGILHIPGIPIFGNMAPIIMRTDSMAELVMKFYKIHPTAKYVGVFDFMNPVIMIRDLELIKTIAIKNFELFPDHRTFIDEFQDPLFGKNLFSLTGDKWKNVRNLLTPAFTSSKMKNMFKLMSNCASGFSDYIVKLPVEKDGTDIKKMFTRYTNDVIATCAFGISVDSMRNPTNEFYMYGAEATNLRSFVLSMKLFLMRGFPKLTKYLGMKFVSQRVGTFFKNIIAATIKTRDEKGIYRPDMIQLMMESRQKAEPGKELTVEDMTAQAFIFFFGGFDTTSTLMSFIAHLLSTNPDVHEKLQNEIDKVLEDNNGQFTYESVNNMEYLDAVINETLRFYPVAVFLDRLCRSSFELPPALPGGKPFTVTKGMGVWFPVYGIQRDPKYYDNADVFDPERFVTDGKKIVNSGAYFPFGIGPRICIGNRFALLETKILLCHLLARCNIKRCPKTPEPLILERTGIAMAPEGGFWVTMEPRSNPSLVETSANGATKA